jgi:hypothetical protein
MGSVDNFNFCNQRFSHCASLGWRRLRSRADAVPRDARSRAHYAEQQLQSVAGNYRYPARTFDPSKFMCLPIDEDWYSRSAFKISMSRAATKMKMSQHKRVFAITTYKEIAGVGAAGGSARVRIKLLAGWPRVGAARASSPPLPAPYKLKNPESRGGGRGRHPRSPLGRLPRALGRRFIF